MPEYDFPPIPPQQEADDVTFDLSGTPASMVLIGVRVTGDAQRRLAMQADGTLSWGPGNAAADATITYSAAGTLEQRSGLIPQNFRWYNRYVSATDYERVSIETTAGYSRLIQQKGASGAALPLYLYNKDAADIQFYTNDSRQWIIDGTTGAFLAGGTNDIGASGQEPRDIYVNRRFIGPVGSIGTPSYSFAGNLTSGVYLAAASNVAITAGGVYIAAFVGSGTPGMRLRSSVALGWQAGTDPTAAPDLTLWRGAAGVLSQSNTVNAQAYRLYGTTDSDTSPANYERLHIFTQAGNATIITQQAGTGVARNLQLATAGAAAVVFSTNGTANWSINSSGHLTCTDNTFDIGASAATRPRSVYTGTSFIAPLGGVGAPTYTFTGATTYGTYLNTVNTNRIAFVISGADIMSIGSGVGITMRASQAIGWSSLGDISTAHDAQWWRGGGGIINQSNLANPQTYRLFNTTDSDTAPVNYERLSITCGAGLSSILQQQGGTGVARSLQLGTSGAVNLQFATSNTNKWEMTSAGHLVASTDNSWDFGQSGVFRVRSMYWGTQAIAPDGAVGTPSYSFATQTNSGFYLVGANDIRFALAGGDHVRLTTGLLGLAATAAFGWGSSGVTSIDTQLRRAGAGIISQSNLANAQIARWYGTTDSDTAPVNYERFEIITQAGNTTLRQTQAGTGAARGLQLTTVGAAGIAFVTNNTTNWVITSSGHLTATDNTFDIGASAATRPRSIYWGTQALGSDGTALNPSHSFASDTDTGFYSVAGNTMALSLGNAFHYYWTNSSMSMRAATTISWSATTDPSATRDLLLRRGGAGVLQQSDTVNAQIYRIYGTTDSDSTPVNYERFQIRTQAGTTVLEQTQAGTGVVRALNFQTVGSANLIFGTVNTDRWKIDTNGHFLSQLDNTYDIGLTGATRPRTVYLAADLRLQSDTSILYFGTSSDVTLRRGAANLLQQSRTTNAQSYYMYETTDSDTAPVNYGRLEFITLAGGYSIQSNQGGTGSSRSLSIGTAGSASLLFAQNGSTRWIIQASGHFVSNSDNSLDVGQSGANRVRNLYAGGFASVGVQCLTKTASTYAIPATEQRAEYDNNGAGAQVAFTLPASAVGLVFTFVVLTAQNVRVSGNGSDTIRVAGSISTATTGHIDNATVGGVIRLTCHVAGSWIATYQEGTWTVT